MLLNTEYNKYGISFLVGVLYGAYLADCSLVDNSFGFHRFRWYETNLILAEQ